MCSLFFFFSPALLFPSSLSLSLAFLLPRRSPAAAASLARAPSAAALSSRPGPALLSYEHVAAGGEDGSAAVAQHIRELHRRSGAHAGAGRGGRRRERKAEGEGAATRNGQVRPRRPPWPTFP